MTSESYRWYCRLALCLWYQGQWASLDMSRHVWSLYAFSLVVCRWAVDLRWWFKVAKSRPQWFSSLVSVQNKSYRFFFYIKLPTMHQWVSISVCFSFYPVTYRCTVRTEVFSWPMTCVRTFIICDSLYYPVKQVYLLLFIPLNLAGHISRHERFYPLYNE